MLPSGLKEVKAEPRYIVSIDLTGPYQPGSNGERYFVKVTCLFSKYLAAAALDGPIKSFYVRSRSSRRDHVKSTMLKYCPKYFKLKNISGIVR
jgi:hypothetical protein